LPLEWLPLSLSLWLALRSVLLGWLGASLATMVREAGVVACVPVTVAGMAVIVGSVAVIVVLLAEIVAGVATIVGSHSCGL